jgi:hypothetical protein
LEEGAPFLHVIRVGSDKSGCSHSELVFFFDNLTAFAEKLGPFFSEALMEKSPILYYQQVLWIEKPVGEGGLGIPLDPSYECLSTVKMLRENGALQSLPSPCLSIIKTSNQMED